MTNTHALDPEPSAAAGSERDRRGVAFDRDIGRWTAPFVMSVINTRIVRRSHALLHYGEGFRYDEAMSMPRGPKGLALASLVTAGIAGFAVATALPKPRDFIQNSRFARSGTGPSREQREDGYFEARFVGETTAGSASSSRLRLEGVVEGKGDPGYASTARMLGEAALCLARDGSSLPPRYGVLTPASAMGMTLVHRLRNAGFTYRVSSSAST